MAKALYRLGMLQDNNDYIEKSKRMLSNMKENMLGYPSYYANWAVLMDYFIDEPYEVAIVGEKADELRSDFEKHFFPNCIVLGSKTRGALPLLQDKFKKGETLIYVCKNKTCQLPVKSVEEAVGQIK